MTNLHPKTPCVSIIMNCLNSSKHLREAINSILKQTFTDYEIIFWDNCSSDESPDIVASYGEKIHYFRGDNIVPLGAGRNLAIRKARGEFIAFLDCDDIWEPEKLEKQIALFNANPRTGLVTTDTVIFDGDRNLRKVFDSAQPARGMVFEELITRQWISMSSAIIRRKALETLPDNPSDRWETGVWFDENLNVCEEADVFYRIAHDWELDFVREPLTKWRVHSSNTTFKKFAQFADETQYILCKHKRIYPGYEEQYPELIHLLTVRSTFEKAVALWQTGKGSEARRILKPYRYSCRKHRLFWLVTYLPSFVFSLAAKCYFALPRLFRS